MQRQIAIALVTLLALLWARAMFYHCTDPRSDSLSTVLAGEPLGTAEQRGPRTALNAQGSVIAVEHAYPSASAETTPSAVSLGRWNLLSHKAILADKESAEVGELLANGRLLGRATEALSYTPSQLAPARERIQWIIFLQSALARKNNPARDQVIATVSKIIRMDNLVREALPDSTLRSLAGDKIELYRALKKEDPLEAAELLADARNSGVNLRVLEFADGLISP